METDHALPAPWPHRLCDETLQKGREASFAAFELSNPPTIVRLHLLSFTWISPCTIDERAHTEPPSDQSAFPISLVIRNSLSLESPIADRERPDLTLIEPAYRPSALHQKRNIFPPRKPSEPCTRRSTPFVGSRLLRFFRHSWRRARDSNPRWALTHNSFQVLCYSL